ncbi:MAG: hypothetical protein KJN63_08615 [Acidimicrobiia bacterium]|nr:hypothetical protein [Acidimicrobiia bacterium]
MATSLHANIKRAAFGALSVSMLAGALVFGTSAAGSQSGGCSGSPVIQFSGPKLGSWNGGSSFVTSKTQAASIPAGTYDLYGAGYDSYEGRAQTPAQLSEKWFAQILDANGNVLATSGTTGDLPDGIESGSWAGGMGLVTLSAPATQVRVVHANQTPDQGDPNSVFPSCLGFSVIAPPTTTTTAPPPVVSTAPPPPPAAVVAPTIPTTVPAAAPAPAPSPIKPAFTG